MCEGIREVDIQNDERALQELYRQSEERGYRQAVEIGFRRGFFEGVNQLTRSIADAEARRPIQIFVSKAPRTVSQESVSELESAINVLREENLHIQENLHNFGKRLLALESQVGNAS